MRQKNPFIFAADFETVVFDNQEYTEVWAAGVCELNTENVFIYNHIDKFMNFLFKKAYRRDVLTYFHNLSFDGSFILLWLIDHGFKQAYYEIEYDGQKSYKWKEDKNLVSREYKYMISRLGQWYSIKIKIGRHMIEFRDSLKLLPFSLKKIGKSFKTKHQKLDMIYEGKRKAGGFINEIEAEYLKNDVLVLKEGIEFFLNENAMALTIGASCVDTFKHMNMSLSEVEKDVYLKKYGQMEGYAGLDCFDKQDFDSYFPDCSKMKLSNFCYKNVDEYCRKGYHGAWVYCDPSVSRQILKRGLTFDVNSLYPSVMHSESGNYYPVGCPTMVKGKPNLKKNQVAFIRFRCRFQLKEGKLPFIQLKGNFLYDPTENLKTSDYLAHDGKYKRYYKIGDQFFDTKVEITMFSKEMDLFLEHYEVFDLEYLDAAVFNTATGLFDTYIDKYKRIKETSKGAVRELAKLFLNNLYGKFATSTDSSFKIARKGDKGQLVFEGVREKEKDVFYIPVGAAITSYAKIFTITAAQKNYYPGKNKGFVYADTDSLHMHNISVSEIKGIKIHNTKFLNWKCEASWDEAIFIRSKCYLEHITHENLEKIEKPYYKITCAGMPERCKQMFVHSLEQTLPEEKELVNYGEKEIEFMKKKRTIKDFDYGLKIYGKLAGHQIPGGKVLVKTTFEMSEKMLKTFE